MAAMRTMVHGMGRASLRQLALSRLGRELLAPPGGRGRILRELKLVHLLFLVSIALLTILGLVISAGCTSSLAWTLQWMQHAEQYMLRSAASRLQERQVTSSRTPHSSRFRTDSS